MNLLTIINVAANAVVAGAVFALALRVFGRADHPIHAHKPALLARKFVSSIVICGAVLNIITLSTPSWTEVLLNIGFSANYLWSIFYDIRTSSPKHSATATKVSGKRSASGPGDPSKTYKGSSAIRIGRKRSTTGQNKSV